MRFIVRTCAGRERYLPYLRKHMPARTEYCFDDTGGGAMGNWLKALRMAGAGPCVFLEDDILLTRDFEEKCLFAIYRKPGKLIQFFSMRGADLSRGSRTEQGRSFLMNQCVYFPAGMAKALVEYHDHAWKPQPLNRGGTDTLVAQFLAACRLTYWLHVPSLVDHRIGVSAIDPRRASTNRQSLTFRDPIPDLGE